MSEHGAIVDGIERADVLSNSMRLIRPNQASAACVGDAWNGAGVPISGPATMRVCMNTQLAQVPQSLQFPEINPSATDFFANSSLCCTAIFYLPP
jgi:hypothetical protein